MKYTVNICSHQTCNHISNLFIGLLLIVTMTSDIPIHCQLREVIGKIQQCQHSLNRTVAGSGGSKGGAHPARAPPISPNDFTDPARPRPLFHRIFTKSCACITIDMHALTKFVSILHKRGSHCGSPSSKKRI